VGKEQEVYLASAALRMRGIVDEVLTLGDGTMAPLDYKFSEAPRQVYRTHRIQVLMYAMLIREAYAAQVPRAFVAYIRGRHELIEVEVTERATREVTALIDEIFAIIATGRLPRRTPQRVRCRDCCYGNICV